MKKYQRIFIIGHPGAGKALIAKEVADKLAWQFVDADFGLEFHMGRKLNDLFDQNGVHAFHQAETSVLKELLQKKNIVVTTDASIVFNNDSKELLKDDLIVYLKVSTQVQLERNQTNPSAIMSSTQIKTFFDHLHAERDHLYAELATLVVDSDDNAVDKHVMRIVAEVNK